MPPPARDVEADIATISGIDAVPTILEVVCRTTGMGFAAVARVTEDRWIACGVRDEIAFGLKPSGELKVETTICHEVRQKGAATIINHVDEDPAFCGHPTPALYGFQSYISMPIVLPDGSFFGTLCAIDPRPHHLDTPEVVGMFTLFAQLIGFHIDAHDRMSESRRVRAQNEILRERVEERTAERDILANIVEATDVMVMAIGLDYKILAINKANVDEFERIFGTRPKVGDGMLGHLAGKPELLAEVKAGWDRGLAGEEITFVEAFGDPDRTRPYYEVKFRTLRNGRGDRIGCYQFVTDVTERLREQAKLFEVQETLRQSQKMEAVGQLTGGIAHDFNNLLTGISGSMEMLLTRLGQGRLNELERYITAAQEAARRAAALTHRLLAFSRRQTLDPKPIDIARLVVDMADMIRRTVGPEITLETVNTVGLWATLVDPNQLENALLNLSINARDAMPNGGRITIETGNRWMDERAAKECDLPPGQYLSLCVSDNGTGMPPDVVARAFDPFFTTKPIGLGTGLGLSMAYGFARQSGGQVRIRSEVGQGTMVCIYLPRHLGAEQVDEEGSARAAPFSPAQQGETVLVVDDEPTVRMLLTDVLGDLGYAALEAGDGPSGLRVLQADTRVDLLVTDVGLPGGMNGRQLADAARVARPGLKVLFITGYAENAVLNHGHLDQGMHVLTKPFDMAVLATRIRDLIAS